MIALPPCTNSTGTANIPETGCARVPKDSPVSVSYMSKPEVTFEMISLAPSGVTLAEPLHVQYEVSRPLPPGLDAHKSIQRISPKTGPFAGLE